VKSVKVFRAASVVAAAALILGTSACSGQSPSYRNSAGQVTATASVDISSLKVGDCIYNVSNLGDTVTNVQVVPCSSQHEGEVYATETNVANVQGDITNYCTDQFALYIGLDYDSSSLQAKSFSDVGSSTNTDVQCVVFLPGQMTTQSYYQYQK